MNCNFFLVVNNRGSVRTTKTTPDLKWDEICVKLNLVLPDALFKKPKLQATITIPDDAAMPQEISAEVTDNVKEAIQQATGLEVKLIVLNPELV